MRVLTALIADDTDQAITIVRMMKLVVLCKTHEVTLRHAAAGAGFPVPVNTPFVLDRSPGQTIYANATAGATIYLMEA
jgi:hypothetical protein